jgi:hypothetical protein
MARNNNVVFAPGRCLSAMMESFFVWRVPRNQKSTAAVGCGSPLNQGLLLIFGGSLMQAALAF